MNRIDIIKLIIIGILAVAVGFITAVATAQIAGGQ